MVTGTVSTIPRFTLKGHLQIARADHWIKNSFVLPGIVVALSIDGDARDHFSWITLLLGMAAVCLVSSSNYVINEVLDAPFDKTHPTKHTRPVPSGRVNIPLAYVEWLSLFAAGLVLSWQVSLPFTLTMVSLWIMGCVYNIPPFRTKDVPYLDVITESINSPLRMLAGWYMTGSAVIPTISLLLSYWMVGCYFMAIKRYAEYRQIASHSRAAAYRKSFSFYTEQRLLISIIFYAAQAMLFFGVFVVRYRLELILLFPFIAAVMAIYLHISFESDSAVQAPEKLYKNRALMTSVGLTTTVGILLLFVRIPIIYQLFPPSPVH
jgi:decaprenyl-phosphate phosphoribosyltransferase